jgi:RimJ/RimL family protein N-acetyltransferase
MAASSLRATVFTAYGIAVDVRPLTGADRDRLATAFARMSDQSRERRFLGPKPRLSGAELTYLTEIDHRRHEALAAVDPDDGRIVGVARYAAEPADAGTADVALFVIDAWQGQGIGTMLGERLLRRADENGIARLTATTFAHNRPARAVMRRLGFTAIGIGADLVEYERRRSR